MNKNIKLVSLIVLILLNAAFIFGQEKTLTKTEFRSLVEKARDQSRQTNYRAVRILETFEGGNSIPVNTSKTIAERTASGDYRWTGESDGKKYETIMVGDEFYSRENDGSWQVAKTGGSGGGVGSGVACGAKIISEAYQVTLGGQLDGKSVDIYEKRQSLGAADCGDEIKGGGAQIIREKYWIARDGLLLKEESVIEESEKKWLKKDITTYEYDQSIKIVPPIKQPKQTR